MHRSLLSTAGIARISARHPWRVLALWAVLLAFAVVTAPTLGDALTTEGSFLSNPDSKRGVELLEERFRGPDPITETIIVRSETAKIADPAFQQSVERITVQLSAMPEIVASYATYYETESPQLISEDGHSTIIPVTLAGSLDEATEHAAAYLAGIAAAEVGSGFEVRSVGEATMNEELTKIAEEDLAKGEMIGLPVAILILIVVFGALAAAGLPLIVGIASIFVAIGLAAVAGRFLDLSFFIVNMIFMIGLAVGIDYALFIVSRYREERQRGRERFAAIEVAGGTASKAVLFSGGTVILALLGMFLVPETTFRSLGLGAVLVVIVAVFASLTLIPAMLGLFGDRIDWPRRRKQPQVQAEPTTATLTNGFWGRMSRVVMSHPVVSLVLAVMVLSAAAIPYFDLNKGSSGVSGLPMSTNTRAAYELLIRDFPAGMVSPVEVVIADNVSDPSVTVGIDTFTTALANDSAFGPATLSVNDAGDVALVSFPLTMAPDSPEAQEQIERLRNDLIPAAFAGTDADVMVTGATALVYDMNAMVDRYMPIVFAFVLGLSFILLMLAFRSIVVPAKAIVMNLLSVGAAYGLIVLVFQKGFGADLLGFQQTPTIEAWLPLFLFCVLFGLSMDYHVFLLSRIREHYDLTKRNSESVAVGLQSTAKLITGAALIMVAVFSGFASGRLVMLQQVGFGLAVAVFLDATIVRSVLVPSSMALLGDRNWYLPKWLSWLPNLQIEGKVEPVTPAPAPAPDPGTAVPVFATMTTSGDD
jgi:putative drug exporter of the RND superfamily